MKANSDKVMNGHSDLIKKKTKTGLNRLVLAYCWIKGGKGDKN